MVKPKSKTTRLKDASTEEVILHAAREEFITHGLRGARMQAIANRAGVNKALLHYYFRSKERLYESVLKSILVIIGNALREHLAQSPVTDDTRALLRLIVSIYIRTLQKHPDFPRLIIRELADGGSHIPIIIETFIKNFGDIPKRIQEQISREQKQGTMQKIPPLHIALNIIGMCAFTFIAKPILATAHAYGVVQANYDDAFFTARIEAIVTMACTGIFKEK